MAMLANAQNTYQAIGIREDLEDVVYRIDPDKTPFLSNLTTDVVGTQTKHEWQTQGLTAPALNSQIEGNTVSIGPAKNRLRIANYMNISLKSYAVTGTERAVNIAGVQDEYDEQRLLKALELKRDMEITLLCNTGYNSGGTTTARQCAGLPAYITNWDAGVTQYSIASGDGVTPWNFAAITTASARAISLSILNSATYNAVVKGAQPNMLLMSAYQKKAFSQLALTQTSGAVQLRYNMPDEMAGKLISAVEMWQSDYGGIQVVPDIQMDLDPGPSSVNTGANAGGGNTTDKFLDFILDTRYLAVAYLSGRQFVSRDLGVTSDADQGYVLSEYTLRVGAPAAQAWVPLLT